MSLLDFKDFLHRKKAPEPQPQQPVENMVTHVDQQLAEHHKKIEGHISQATNESVPEGSSIPASNTDPLGPLAVIQGARHKDVMIDRQREINITTPDDYKNQETGFGNTADRIILGKDGLTTPIDFMAQQAKRDQATEAVKQQVANELKKAA